MSNFVATDVNALFNIYVEKSTTWSCKTEGGGGVKVRLQSVWKTSDLVEDGFPDGNDDCNGNFDDDYDGDDNDEDVTAEAGVLLIKAKWDQIDVMTH